jgi:MFS family permease
LRQEHRDVPSDVVSAAAASSLPIPDPQSRLRYGAFAYRDFRLLWFGLIISNTGSWMQYLAQGWLVVELAQTAERGALYLGLVGLVRSVPVILLSGFAGTLADRTDRRKILVAAQIVMGGSALALGLLVAAHVAQIWMVMLFAAISSAGSSFDAPTRQSMVPMIVGKEELMNAIGLNSAAFNGPAIVGPALAGVLVAEIGLAPCFFLNAASYVAVIVAIVLMSPKPPIGSDRRAGIWHEMLEGLHYMRKSGPIFAIIGLSTIVAIVARPYIQLLPAFSKGVIGGGPAALGVLGSAAGAGALSGSIGTAFLGLRRGRGLLMIACAFFAGAALAVFSQTKTTLEAAAALFFLGISIMLFMGLTNTLLQSYSPIEMRGRVMSIYTMVFLGLMPLGTWLLGTVAGFTTLRATLTAAGITIVVVAIVASTRKDLRALQ